MRSALAATRAAAAAHDPDKATGALRTLSDVVARESRAGRLSRADERALRAAIAQARRRVRLDVVAPPAPQPAAPPPAVPVPVPQAPPADKDDKDEQQGEGKDEKDDKQEKGDKDEQKERREGDGRGGG